MPKATAPPPKPQFLIDEEDANFYLNRAFVRPGENRTLTSISRGPFTVAKRLADDWSETMLFVYDQEIPNITGQHMRLMTMLILHGEQPSTYEEFINLVRPETKGGRKKNPESSDTLATALSRLKKEIRNSAPLSYTPQHKKLFTEAADMIRTIRKSTGVDPADREKGTKVLLQCPPGMTKLLYDHQVTLDLAQP